MNSDHLEHNRTITHTNKHTHGEVKMVFNKVLYYCTIATEEQGVIFYDLMICCLCSTSRFTTVDRCFTS